MKILPISKTTDNTPAIIIGSRSLEDDDELSGVYYSIVELAGV